MKKMILAALIFLQTILVEGQGIYNLWGITGGGGSDGTGVIFKTDGSGNHLQVQHHFHMNGNGSQPQMTKLADYNDKFYGMTLTGGSLNAGTIFEWDPVTNIFTSKLSFTGTNGKYPYGSLSALNNKFYGITEQGGINNAGVIFEWDPISNSITNKIDLSDSTGSYPQGDLLYCNGNFYGSTLQGGSYGVGVLFKWNPATNVYKKILDFDRENGDFTSSQLILLNDKIYGVTNGTGMGAIFQIDPATDSYSRQFEFTLYQTGERPQGNIIAAGGKIYGFHNSAYVNDEGSATNRYAIFEWDPETGLFADKVFLSDIGGWAGNIIKAGDKFYGAVNEFGEEPGLLFEWDPVTNLAKRIFDFNRFDGNGLHPMGALTFKNGILYGMTAAGGAFGWDNDMEGYGVIYQWDIAGNAFTKRIDFSGNITSSGIAGLCYYKGKLYGRTESSAGGGSVFEYDPLLNKYQEKTGFTGGGYSASPAGNMVSFQDKLYGVCRGGSDRGYGGEIFEYDPATNIYQGRHWFLWPSPLGYFPTGGLTLYNNKFYGSTLSGGENEDGLTTSDGVLFTFDPVSGAYQRAISMQATMGSYPMGSLVLFKNKLYGGTSTGGLYNQGVLFEWNPADNTYTKKIDLAQSTGIVPADITVYKNNLYVPVQAGGIANAGALYEWNPVTNLYTKKIDFTGVNGARPAGGMIINNGRFYGVTSSGGDAGAGVLFEWDPLTNIYRKKIDFSGVNGAHPSGSLTLVPAPVAAGAPGICTLLPTVTIDKSNYKQWVPLVDNEGNAVAEINANGNRLGVVKATLFINNGAVRQDANKKLYLDRNISITSQVQPATAISIRLYITAAEYNRLKIAVNAAGAGSGITNTSDLQIYTAGACCPAPVPLLINAIPTSTAAWENNYVLTGTADKLSGFYIAAKQNCKAPVICNLSASPAILWPPNHQLQNITVNYKVTAACTPVSTWLSVSSNEPCTGAPDWIVKDEHHLQLRAERAGNGNGRVYTITVYAKDAAGNTSSQKTTVKVPHHAGCIKGKAAIGYDEYDESIVLSGTVAPNPSSNYFTLQLASGSAEKMQLTLSDISGRVISRWTASGNNIRFGDQLSTGIYLLQVTWGGQQLLFKLSKK